MTIISLVRLYYLEKNVQGSGSWDQSSAEQSKTTEDLSPKSRASDAP